MPRFSSPARLARITAGLAVLGILPVQAGAAEEIQPLPPDDTIHHGRRAFTLIDLLVVCALIAILAGILFPVFAQVRDSIRQSACLSNLRQLWQGHRIYVQDYDDTLPPACYPVESLYWPAFLRPYYRDPRLLDQGFLNPQQREEGRWLADYVLCAWGPGGLGTLGQPYYRWPGALAVEGSRLEPMRLGEVRRPAEVLQFADGLTSGAGLRIFSRHGNGTLNGAYVDGHVGRVSEAAYNRVGQDEHGYFWAIAAADR